MSVEPHVFFPTQPIRDQTSARFAPEVSKEPCRQVVVLGRICPRAKLVEITSINWPRRSQNSPAITSNSNLVSHAHHSVSRVPTRIKMGIQVFVGTRASPERFI